MRITELLGRSIYLPLAVCLFFVSPNRSVEVTVVDGPNTEYRGFPLLWQSDLHFSSGATELYVGPIVIDLAFFALIGFLLVQAWRRIPFMGGKISSIICGAAIWVCGTLYAVYLVGSLVLLDTFCEWWYDPSIFDRLVRAEWRWL